MPFIVKVEKIASFFTQDEDRQEVFADILFGILVTIGFLFALCVSIIGQGVINAILDAFLLNTTFTTILFSIVNTILAAGLVTRLLQVLLLCIIEAIAKVIRVIKKGRRLICILV